jgi:hypothetical protein
MHGVLGAMLCLGIPLTAAYAQDPNPIPDFTGTVSCVETTWVQPEAEEDLRLVSTTTEYAVELIGGTILGRWGEDKDTIYRTFTFIEVPGEYPIDLDEIDIEDLLSDISVTFWTMPVEAMCGPALVCIGQDRSYSETGWWKYRLHKGEVNIRGTSFAVLDYHFGGEIPEMSAKCTWDLKGPLPSIGF